MKFDVNVSEKRTNVVDVLYDQTVTFQLDALKAATKAITIFSTSASLPA